MDRYYKVEETPLKFHEFLCVFLWFKVVYHILHFIIEVEDSLKNMEHPVFFALRVIWLAIGLIALFAAAIGLRKFKGYAWYCVLAVFYLDAMTYWAVFSFLVAVLIHLYYAKRKPLFFPERYPQPQSGPAYGGTAYDWRTDDRFRESGTSASSSTDARFCRYCGSRLAPDSRFCGSCGAKLED